MNLNDNLHICASFFNGFLIAVFCNDMMNMVAKIICFRRMEVGHWYYTVVYTIIIYFNLLTYLYI